MVMEIKDTGGFMVENKSNDDLGLVLKTKRWAGDTTTEDAEIPFDFFVYWETGATGWVSAEDVSIVREKNSNL